MWRCSTYLILKINNWKRSLYLRYGIEKDEDAISKVFELKTLLYMNKYHALSLEWHELVKKKEILPVLDGLLLERGISSDGILEALSEYCYLPEDVIREIKTFQSYRYIRSDHLDHILDSFQY